MYACKSRSELLITISLQSSCLYNNYDVQVDVCAQLLLCCFFANVSRSLHTHTPHTRTHTTPTYTHHPPTHTQGVVFHSTQSVQPPHTPLKSIIECAGGELLNLSELRSRFGRRLERASAALMIISTPEDLAAGLCSEFLTLGLSECMGWF